jgi:hypothetical protein
VIWIVARRAPASSMPSIETRIDLTIGPRIAPTRVGGKKSRHYRGARTDPRRATSGRLASSVPDVLPLDAGIGDHRLRYGTGTLTRRRSAHGKNGHVRGQDRSR